MQDGPLVQATGPGLTCASLTLMDCGQKSVLASALRLVLWHRDPCWAGNTPQGLRKKAHQDWMPLPSCLVTATCPGFREQVARERPSCHLEELGLPRSAHCSLWQL